MGAGVERHVLEVHSHGGRVLEGVFEVNERAAADNYVSSLAAGCGVRAKVLELGVRGGLSRTAEVAQAWAETPYPPAWWVLTQPGVDIVLAVYGAELATTAAEKQAALATELAVDIDVCVHIHPTRPKVGDRFVPGRQTEEGETIAAYAKGDAEVTLELHKRVHAIVAEGCEVKP